MVCLEIPSSSLSKAGHLLALSSSQGIVSSLFARLSRSRGVAAGNDRASGGTLTPASLRAGCAPADSCPAGGAELRSRAPARDAVPPAALAPPGEAAAERRARRRVMRMR